MINTPDFSAFRFYFPKSFFLPATREKFENYMKLDAFLFEDLGDYVNSTVTSAKAPGLNDPGTVSQSIRQGENRSYASGLLTKQIIEKKLKVTFQVKESYLNWAIMYFNFLDWTTHKKMTPDRVFLPDVFLQLMDINGNIVTEFIYKDIQIRDLSDIEFTTKSNGIISREFDMTFAFNDFDIKFNFDKLQSTRDSVKHEY